MDYTQTSTQDVLRVKRRARLAAKVRRQMLRFAQLQRQRNQRKKERAGLKL